MSLLHPLAAAAVAALAGPAGLGALATALLGASRDHGKPFGLVIHAFTRRSPLDCSHVGPQILDTLLCMSGAVSWQTVRAAASATAGPTAGSSGPARVLTFDDGLEEVYTAGLPLLEKNGVKATVFAVAGCIGSRSDAGDVYGRQRFLSAGQLREIAELGHEIGSHSMTHPDLTLLDTASARQELADSRRLIEDTVGRPVTSIAFPFGSWNRRLWALAQESGYTAATALRPAMGVLPERMIRVYGTHAFDTAADLAAVVRRDGAPLVHARARVMSQFARGGPLWRFRSGYRVTGPRF